MDFVAQSAKKLHIHSGWPSLADSLSFASRKHFVGPSVVASADGAQVVAVDDAVVSSGVGR